MAELVQPRPDRRRHRAARCRPSSPHRCSQVFSDPPEGRDGDRGRLRRRRHHRRHRRRRSASDAKVFSFPPVDGGEHRTVVVGGDVAVTDATTTRPGRRSWSSWPRPRRPRCGRSGAASSRPTRTSTSSVVPRRRRPARSRPRSSSPPTTLRFDLSDLQPAAFGGDRRPGRCGRPSRTSWRTRPTSPGITAAVEAPATQAYAVSDQQAHRTTPTRRRPDGAADTGDGDTAAPAPSSAAGSAPAPGGAAGTPRPRRRGDLLLAVAVPAPGAGPARRAGRSTRSCTRSVRSLYGRSGAELRRRRQLPSVFERDRTPQRVAQQPRSGWWSRRRSPPRSAWSSRCSPSGCGWQTAFKVAVFMPMAISFLAAGVIFRFVYEREPAPRRRQRGGRRASRTRSARRATYPARDPSRPRRARRDATAASPRPRVPAAGDVGGHRRWSAIPPDDVPARRPDGGRARRAARTASAASCGSTSRRGGGGTRGAVDAGRAGPARRATSTCVRDGDVGRHGHHRDRRHVRRAATSPAGSYRLALPASNFRASRAPGVELARSERS